MLLNSYNISIFPNRKFKIPKEIITTLGNEFILSRLGKMLWLQTYNEWSVLESKILSIKSAESVEFRRMFIGSSSELEINKKGIATIPNYLSEYSDIGDKATFLFAGKHARVTDKKIWDFLKTEPDQSQAKLFFKNLYFPINYNRLDELNRYSTDVSRFTQDLKKFSSKKDYRSIEKIISELFGATFSSVIELRQYQKDDGVDLIIYLESNNKVEVIYIQCKAGKKKADVRDVRELIGVIGRDSVSFGLLISLSGFTKNAMIESKISQIKIDLISAYKLAEWIENYQKNRISE